MQNERLVEIESVTGKAYFLPSLVRKIQQHQPCVYTSAFAPEWLNRQYTTIDIEGCGQIATHMLSEAVFKLVADALNSRVQT